ncbi:MAG: hypothetical protein ACLQVY_02310 [Limisphaerales bacterium]
MNELQNLSVEQLRQVITIKEEIEVLKLDVTDHFKTSHSGSNQNQPLRGA